MKKNTKEKEEGWMITQITVKMKILKTDNTNDLDGKPWTFYIFL